MIPPILVHIGYPKAGSSTLQQGVLSRHGGINYLSGEPLAARLGTDAPDAFRLYKALTGKIALPQAEIAAVWRRHYIPLLETGRLNVLSTEHFVQCRRPLAAVAADLRAVVGPADILIVVREQADLLRSKYDMEPFLDDDPRRAYLPFPAWLERTLAGAGSAFAARLRFRDVARTYADAFGPGRVHVVSFAKLFRDTPALAPFCAALGLDAAEFVRLVGAAGQVGAAERHGYKKLTRRVGGGGVLRRALPPAVLDLAKRALQRLPARRTAVGPAEAARIAAFYAGERPADLAGLPLGTIAV